jgi:hypothetical protein
VRPDAEVVMGGNRGSGVEKQSGDVGVSDETFTPTSDGVSSGFDQTFDGEESAPFEEDSGGGIGVTGGVTDARGPRRTGRPPGRIYFKTIQDVTRTLNIVFNEFREDKLTAPQLNACVVCLNAAAANLRFEKQQQRNQEEEQFVQRLQQVIADNERLREKLVEGGIISRSDLRAVGFDA